MKTALLLIAFLFISYPGIAQTGGEPGKNANRIIIRCTPGKGQLVRPPMVVIFSHGKIIFQSDTLQHKDFQPLKALNPKIIKKINVLKDTAQTKKYGGMAQYYGVIEIYLNDKKYRKERKAFRDSIALWSKQAAVK